MAIELALIPVVLLKAGSIGWAALARPHVLVAVAVLAVVLAAPAGDCLHLYLPRCWRAGG